MINATLKKEIAADLAPGGTLRAAINMSNFLLVSATDSNGNPDGLSPAMARSIAEELGVKLQLLPFKGPGEVADGALSGSWDIANIAAEAERAKVITFSPAYCEIQATYLVPANSAIKSLEDVDKPGIRIAVKGRAAYDLWLTENLKHAELVRAESLDASFEVFKEQQLEVLAGLRPKLIEQQALLEGSTLFDQSFTAVQQSIGCQTGKQAAAEYLSDFVQRAKSSGLIERLISHYNVAGRLSVAS